MRTPSFITRTALVAAAVTAGALLSPALPAQAGIPQCTVDHCDVLIEYYSDATYTVRVGEYEDGPCGQVDNGVHTSYARTFRQYC
ncbi:MAG: hypothetical protein ACR2N4_10830 [Jatrophihabitans sp.]